MENVAAAVLTPEDLHEVYHGFKHQVWALGANVIVGWRPVPFGLQVLYLPSVVLKKAAKTYPQLLDPVRYIDNDRKLARLTKVGCTVIEISLHFDLPDGPDVIRQIDEITRRGALDAKREPPAKPKPKLQLEPEPVIEPPAQRPEPEPVVEVEGPRSWPEATPVRRDPAPELVQPSPAMEPAQPDPAPRAFSDHSGSYPELTKKFAHSVGVNSSMISAMAAQRSSTVRAAAFLSNALSFEKACSMGLKSGE